MMETLAGNQNEFHVVKLVNSFTLYNVCVLVGSLLYLQYWKREVKGCVHYFYSKFYFSLNDSPLKTMKNVFYFI